MHSTPLQGEVTHQEAASLTLWAQVKNWPVYGLPWTELAHVNYLNVNDTHTKFQTR